MADPIVEKSDCRIHVTGSPALHRLLSNVMASVMEPRGKMAPTMAASAPPQPAIRPLTTAEMAAMMGWYCKPMMARSVGTVFWIM